jgi:hypothetical protein
LPSSLSRVLSSALGYSPRLPESVCGTVTTEVKPRSFSRKHGLTEFVGQSPSSSPLGIMSSRLWLSPPTSSPYGLEPRPCGHARMGPSYPSSSLLGVISLRSGAGILTCFPSPTPCGLGLGTDLPWEDYLHPGNLRLTANEFFTRFIATHACIRSSLGRYHSFPYGLYLLENTPLPIGRPAGQRIPQLRYYT